MTAWRDDAKKAIFTAGSSPWAAPLLLSAKSYHGNIKVAKYLAPNLDSCPSSLMSATQTISKPTTTKENERPPLARLNLQKTTYPGGLGGGMTTPYKPAMPNRPSRPSSIHQRAFHREPYPATSPTSPHSPQFLTLPVLPSPTCPTFQSILGPRSLSYAPTSLLSISQLRIIGSFYDSELFWLSLYFLFNLGLTLYNKGVLTRFPFPYTLSAVHALCGSIGGLILVKTGVFIPTPLNFTETCVLVAFSVLYTVNIIVSNISLGMVTIPVSTMNLFDLCDNN